MEGEMLLERRFPAEAKQLKGVRALVTEAVGKAGADDDVAADVVIAVDEACQNIIRHAYRDVDDGEIELSLTRQEDVLVVLIRDYAETVDTTKIKPRDLDDLRPGGLGTHFMHSVMDQVEFMPPPAEMGNILRMTKRIG